MRVLLAFAVTAMTPVAGQAAHDGCCGHHGSGQGHGCGMPCCQGGGDGGGGGMGRSSGRGPSVAREYDPATVTTLSGTVEAVTTDGGGLHATVRDDERVVDVHFGPWRFSKDKGLQIEVGDTIEVTGSLRDSVLIVREVKAGGRTVRLRDEQGVPDWAGPRRP
jgi:hypothetical protein